MCCCVVVIYKSLENDPPRRNNNSKDGTPTKRQVSKRLVSKHLTCQVYITSGLQKVRLQNVRLQNVRFTKRQVFKTSGCKKTSIYILYLWLVEIRRFCCSHVCRQSDGCVLFSILEGILPYVTIISKNDTLFSLNRNANLTIAFLFYKYIKFDVLKPDVLKPDVL